MKIGIDSRFWGLEHAGLGRYLMELVKGLSRLDSKNQYKLFLRKKYLKQIKLPENFKKIEAEINHYTFEEQWLLAEIFAKEKLDLLHVPHFNVPIRYKKPFVVTIHDLLWHDVKGPSVTTQNTMIYLIKYLGYRSVVRYALKNSRNILVPSNTIKEKLVSDHRVNQEKITVTYEAPSRAFKSIKKSPEIIKKYRLNLPFVLYVGSVYPHKNIMALVDAVKLCNKSGSKINLVISSSRSAFLDSIAKKINRKNVNNFVKIFHLVPDEELAVFMKSSLALVQPSLSEGFGLTGLEAMSAGTGVVASDLPIFREIYQDAAIFVDPKSPTEIADKIQLILKNTKERKRIIAKGKKRVTRFSWNELARKTQEVYEKSYSKIK